VLCDVVMAGVDGASLLRALRESPATERLPVILMSMLSEDRVWALCTGYAKYLRKPLAMDALHAAIADVTAPAAHGFTLNDALRTGPAH
jgi:DNA-binding response OmpR family regulator